MTRNKVYLPGGALRLCEFTSVVHYSINTSWRESNWAKINKTHSYFIQSQWWWIKRFSIFYYELSFIYEEDFLTLPLCLPRQAKRPFSFRSRIISICDCINNTLVQKKMHIRVKKLRCSILCRLTWIKARIQKQFHNYE